MQPIRCRNRLIIFRKPVPGMSRQALARFAARARRAAGLHGPVNVLITHNAEMRTLNQRFRKLHKPTDVLSFPAYRNGGSAVADEIAISAPIAAANARKLGHSATQEIKVLMLHGMLHLAGYDHEHRDDGGAMARKESRLRKELGLPSSLISRTLISTAADAAPSMRRGSRGKVRRP